MRAGVCLLLIEVLAVFSNGYSQSANTNFSKYGLSNPTTTWTRTAFEAGVKYGGTDQIATTTTTCPPYGYAADAYSHSVEWGVSGGQDKPTTNGAPVNKVFYNGMYRYVVPNGTYPVYANGFT